MSRSVRATWIQGTWKSAQREATPLSAHDPNSQMSGFCLSAALLTIGSSPHDRNTDGHPEWLMCPPDLVEGNAENGSRYELVSLCSAPSKAHMEKIGGRGKSSSVLGWKVWLQPTFLSPDPAFHRKLYQLPAWYLMVVFALSPSSFPFFFCSFPSPLLCEVMCPSFLLLFSSTFQLRDLWMQN